MLICQGEIDHIIRKFVGITHRDDLANFNILHLLILHTIDTMGRQVLETTINTIIIVVNEPFAVSCRRVVIKMGVA